MLFTISFIILTSFLILFAVANCTNNFDDIHQIIINTNKSSLGDAHKYECALTLAHKSTDLDDKADSLAELAGLYIKAGDKETAQQLLAEALDIAKTIEDSLSKAGVIWRVSEVGEVEHLEEGLLIARTIKTRPSGYDDRRWAYQKLAENFIRLGRNDRAKFVLDEAASYLSTLKEDDSEQKELELSFLGQLYAQAGFCKEGLGTSLAFKNKARIGEIKRESAICLAANNQPKSALATASSIKVYDEMKVEALLKMRNTFIKTGNKALADQALRQAVETINQKDWSYYDEDRSNAHIVIAEIYRNQGEDEKSLKILQKAETLAASTDKPSFKESALARVAVGFAKAQLFEKAVSLAVSARSSKSLTIIAQLMLEAGDRTNAQTTLNQALNLPYQTPNSLIEIAKVYAANGYQQETLDIIERLNQPFPYPYSTNEELYYNSLVSTHLKLKNYDSALDNALKIKDLQSKVKAVASVEDDIYKTNAVINNNTQKLLSQIGCEVK
jgi:Tfp pilus assembly protein PilF